MLYRTSQVLVDVLPSVARYLGSLPLSYSRLKMLERCPLQYDYKYRKKMKARNAPVGIDDTEIGKIAHRIAEYTMRTARDRGDLSTAGGDFNAHFEKALSEAKNDYQRKILTEIRIPVAKSLSNIFLLASKGGYSPYTEREIRFDKNGRHYPTLNKGRGRSGCSWENTGFIGYVDLELSNDDGKLLIFDYKTELPSDTRKEEVEKQMGLYAFFEFECRRGVREIETYVVYLKNAVTQHIATYARDTNYGVLKNFVEEMFNNYLRALENFEAKKVKNDMCVYCDYQDLCNSR